MYCLTCGIKFSALFAKCPQCQNWLRATTGFLNPSDWLEWEDNSPPPSPRTGVEPSLSLLRSVLAQADLVQVLADNDRQDVCLEVTDRQVLAELTDLLSFEEDSETYYRCCCSGEEEFVFFRQGEELATLSLHHGTSLRCSLWVEDVYLLNGPRLLRWLASRGVSEPLRRAEEESRSW